MSLCFKSGQTVGSGLVCGKLSGLAKIAWPATIIFARPVRPRSLNGMAVLLQCALPVDLGYPLLDPLEPVSAGPLFCRGITVFNPEVQHSLKPTARAGVVGIGGLGHLGHQFLRKWGCEVIAFSSNPSKREEALKFGAHQVVDSRTASEQLKGSLDLILVTANVPLDWEAYLALLAPKGTLHFVGAVPQPISVSAFTPLAGQKSVSGSPLGSPATTRCRIEFCTAIKSLH
jgi:uncharacterized zinc-type alcohol dehydrogenase-like protein